LRALVGKLRVLPERAAASRAFASQLVRSLPSQSIRTHADLDEILYGWVGNWELGLSGVIISSFFSWGLVG
jgi:hypothetical protein